MKKLFFTLLVVWFSLNVGQAQDRKVIDHASHGGPDVQYKYGFVDANEKWIIQPRYDNAEWHSDPGIAIVTIYGSPYQRGIINKYGDFIIPLTTEYKRIRWNVESRRFLLAKKIEGNELWGVADINGKIIIPIKYRSLVWEEDRFKAELPSGIIVYADSDGNVVGAPTL
jgi:hypothetical protein